MPGAPEPAPGAGTARQRPTAAAAALPARLRSRHALCAVVSLATVLAAYPDVVFGGKTFLAVGLARGSYGDPPYAADYQGPAAPEVPEADAGAESWAVHPWAYLERRALLAGTLPFWNRHNGFGWPLLSNGQTGTFNPLHWIELLNPDWPALWDLHFLLLRFLAAYFTCLLLLALGASPGLALLGAPLAALHGSFLALLVRADLNAFALLPAALYALVSLRQRPALRPAAGLALALALVLVAGHPQPSFAVLLTAALIGAGMLVHRERRLAYALHAAAAGVIACLVTAPFWLPLILNLRTAWHVHPKGLGLRALPPFNALQWLIPGVLSNGRITAFLDRPAVAFSYLGGLVGTLAVLAMAAPLCSATARRRLVLLAVPLLFTLKIFGFGPVQWLGRLPFLEQTTFVYFYFPATFLFGVSGLLAVNDLRALPRRTAAALAAGAAVLVLAAIALAPYFVPRGVPGGLSPAFQLQWPIYSLLACAAAALAFGASSPDVRTARASLLVLGLALFAELACYRYPLSARGNPSQEPPYARWLQDQQRDGPWRVLGLGGYLFPNYATVFGLEDVRLCDALVPQETMTLIQRHFEARLDHGWMLYGSPTRGFRLPARLLDVTNVRYVIGEAAGMQAFAAEHPLVYRDPAMGKGAIYENRTAWPRAFIAPAPLRFASQREVLEKLGTLDTARPYAAVGEDFPESRWRALCGAGCNETSAVAPIELQSGINDLSLRAELSAPGVLVISETFTPGWRAFVDGVEEPIFHANYLFRGLLLDKGSHAVRLEYRPPGWRSSLWLAGLGALLCLLAALYGARRARAIIEPA